MDFNYKLLPEAVEDIEQSIEWYEENGGEKLAERFFKAYLDARHQILDSPETYATIFEEYRRIRLKKFPYKIIYKFVPDTIYVIAVVHDKRDPSFWEKRLKN